MQGPAEVVVLEEPFADLNLVAAAAGGLVSKHSTDVVSPPRPPHVCMSIHHEGTVSSDIARVHVLNDPPARKSSGARGGAERA